MPSSRRQSRQYQRSDLGIAPYAKPHPPSWAGRRGRCEICVRFAGTLSGRCVATCPPCGGKAMTPHQSPALRESAADSFSSRRSRLHLIRHAADRYKPHDTEGRGGTSRQYQRSDLRIAPYAKPCPPSWAGRRGRCVICVRFAGTSSGRCVATCPPCGGKAMTPHQSPALREIGG